MRSREQRNLDKSMKPLSQSETVRSQCRLATCWVWDKTVNDFAQERVKGYSLNVCAGLSPLGDVKIDLDPQNPNVKKSDMNELPYPDNTFDTVISDPPWKIGIFQRQRPFFECVRVCKVGGT